MKIVYNEKCSKCRAVKAILDERNVSWSAVHYLDEGIDEVLLAELKEKTGLSLSGLVRTGDACWKTWGLNPQEMPEAELLAKVLEHPEVLQRPIAISGDRAVIARPPEQVLELLGTYR